MGRVEELEARITRLERGLELSGSITARSPRLRVRFPAANTARDIAHRLGVVPNGFQVEWATAPVHATPGVLWTPEVAFLQSTAANAEAVIVFFVATDPDDLAYT